MDELEPITPLQVYESIDKLNAGTGKTMEEMKKNAISILLYKEILKFDKDEVENLANRWGRKLSLFYSTLSKNEPLLFAGILKIGACHDLLHPQAQWIVNNIENIPLNLYEVIYNTEQQIRFYKSYPKEMEGKDANYLTLHLIDGMSAYIEKNPSEFSDNLLNKFYEAFHDSLHGVFLSSIKDNIIYRPAISEKLVAKMHEYNHDIDEEYIVNQLFCSELDVWNRKNEKFILEKNNLAKIDSLLKLGFSLDPNYTFHGENLLTAILKGQHEETIKTLMPYTDIDPSCNNIEEQKLLIENLKNKPFYNEIKSAYLKGLFEYVVPQTEAKKLEQSKTKI